METRRFFALVVLALLALSLRASARQWSWFYSSAAGVAIVTPDHRIGIDYFLYREQPQELTSKLYRLTEDQAIQIVKNTGASEPREALLAQGELLRTFQLQRENRPDDERGFSDRYTLRLDALPLGFYGIVTKGDGQTRTSLLEISTLGIVANESQNTRLYWGVDLRTFLRHAGPTTFSFLDSGVTRTIAGNRDSVALSHETPHGGVVVVRTADGSVVVQDAQQIENAALPERGFVRTDRPVYRPGQTVHFAVALRNGSVESLRPSEGKRRIVVRDAQGNAIFDRTMRLDRYGSLSGEVRLPIAPLGNYQISVGDVPMGGFTVEAYRKPEYEMFMTAPHTVVIGGDAATVTIAGKYFFGRPAAGMHVHYSISRRSVYRWYYGPYRFIPRINSLGQPDYGEVASGDAETGADGRYEISIPTKRTETFDRLDVSAELRDASGRTVSSSLGIEVVPAAYAIDLHPSSWFGMEKEPFRVDLRTADYERHAWPNATLHAKIVRETWDAKTGKSLTTVVQQTDVRTNGDGKSALEWTPQQAGSYQIHVFGTDDRGRKTTANLYCWIAGDDSAFLPFEQPTIISEKESYKPGETANLLVAIPKPDSDVLAIVTTDRIREARVFHIRGRMAKIPVPVPQNASRFGITVELPSETGVAMANIGLTVLPDPHSLHIAISANRARYQPGERGTFDIRVTDVSGRPVQAQVMFGVVDKAIYAIQPEAFDPSYLFAASVYLYPQHRWYRPNQTPPPMPRMLKTIARVTSRTSNLVQSGTTADVYEPKSSSENGVPSQAYAALAPRATVRQNFADTAYWAADIVTDRDGRAQAHVTWPDNLTTWVATGIAGSDSQFGIDRGSALVTKDFLVRLALPRFLRQRDHSFATGIVHGQKIRKRIELMLDGYSRERLGLDENASANARWPLNASADVGAFALTLRGDDGALSDAMKLTLPIEPSGAAEHVRGAGRLQATQVLPLSLPPGYVSGDMTLTLTPSIFAQLIQNVRLLQVYPYYCTEQTLSTSLPAVFVDRAAKRIGMDVPSDVQPADVVKRAIARLGQLQHWDGSWGWWEQDKAHPFMTAYAMYGLAEFRKAGYTVPPSMIERGERNLIEQLQDTKGDTLRLWGGAQPGSEWNTRAFMLFSLSNLDPHAVDRALLAKTRERAKTLNSYAVAVLGLAYHAIGDDDSARSLLDILRSRIVVDGEYAHWQGDTWHYAWEDDPVETTAYGLRLYAAVAPNDPMGDRITNFLRAQQRGNWWFTTKDTAAAIYALSERDVAGGIMHPDGRVEVWANGSLLASREVRSPILDRSDAEIVLPAKELRDGSHIVLKTTGNAAVYWSSDWVRYAPWSQTSVADRNRSILERLFPSQPSLTVTRTYRARHKTWQVGDEIAVDLTVAAKDRTEYVAIEDPFPAGVEMSPEQGQGDISWSGAQFFDDRAVFFEDAITPDWPLHLTYTFRVTTAGDYAAPPPTAYAMYGPPVSAVGRGQYVSIEP